MTDGKHQLPLLEESIAGLDSAAGDAANSDAANGDAAGGIARRDFVKIVGAGLAVAGLGGLAALGRRTAGTPQSGPDAVAAPAAAGEQVTLATLSAGYREGLAQLAREYEAKRPGVRVDIQIMPSNGYETWLRTQVPGAGASGPDIFNANYGAGFYEQGLIINFAPFLRERNPYTGRAWHETLSAQFLEKYKVGGDVTQIPLDFIEIAFFYNADLFKKLGLSPPRTWEEMLTQAEFIRHSGTIPFAVPGTAESYWAGTVGWMVRFFSDAYTRHLVPLVMARPGDWNYEAPRNKGFRLDLRDPYNDARLIVNNERILRAVRDRRLRFDDGRFAEIYSLLKQFSRHWQSGFHGTTPGAAYHLFLTGRAAMLLSTSAEIGQLLRDMDDLPPPLRFAWSVFPVPPLRSSRFGVPAFRGVGGAGTTLAVVRKNPRQTRRSVDFMMFLTTPHAAKVLVQKAVENRRPLVGPMLIPGATIPGRIGSYFRAFEGRGFEKLSFRGLMDEQQSVWEWTVWAQRYMEDRLSLDGFLKRNQRLMEEAVPRVAALQKVDMNPRTRDVK